MYVYVNKMFKSMTSIINKKKNTIKKIREQKKTMYFFCMITFIEILITLIILIPSRPTVYYAQDSNAAAEAIPLVRVPAPTLKYRINPGDNVSDVNETVQVSDVFMMLVKGRCSQINNFDNFENLNLVNNTVLKNAAVKPELSNFQACMIRTTSASDAVITENDCVAKAQCRSNKPICYQHEMCYLLSDGLADLCLSGIYNDYCVRSGRGNVDNNGKNDSPFYYGESLFYNFVLIFCILSLVCNIVFLVIMVFFSQYTIREYKLARVKCYRAAVACGKKCHKCCNKKKDDKKNEDKNNDDKSNGTKKMSKYLDGCYKACCSSFAVMLFFGVLDLGIVAFSSMSYHILVRPPISGDIFGGPGGRVGDNKTIANVVNLNPNTYDANNHFESFHPLISPILTEFLVPAMLLLAAVISVPIFIYRILFVYSVLYPEDIKEDIEEDNRQQKSKVNDKKGGDSSDSDEEEVWLNYRDIELRF